jgi:AcrR family transcriptional regulator
MRGRRQGASDELEPGLLRPGGNGLGREHPIGRKQVSDIQRARILAAMVEVVSGLGAANVTVAHVVSRSGVSRRTFYELFEDREDCFLAAFDEGIARLVRTVVPAYEGASRWRERIRAGLVAALSFLDSDGDMARLLVVESLAAGPRALGRRSQVLASLMGAVDEGRGEANFKPGSEPASVMAEGVVGAVLAVLHGRLVERDPGRLVELAGPLVGMIVLPYLGRAAARRELERPVPEGGGESHHGASDPLRDLGMRLTYRTVRVLMGVAANPGSSNRTVANASGISDQGQISKLLARLQGLDLIENGGAGPARGEPNAWTLTDRGREVEGAIAQQTARS